MGAFSETSHGNLSAKDDRRSSWGLMHVATVIAIVLILSVANSSADVYRYVDDDGVECYSDCPIKKGAVRIMRDRRSPGLLSRKGTTRPSSTLAEAAKPVANGNGVLEKSAVAGMALPALGRISSTVGLRHDPIDGLLRFHNGIDIAVPEGTTVKPVAPGTVYFSGIRNGYGNMVIIAHDDGMITIYAHNSLNLVKTGESISKDASIALSGSTGRSTGPHLHFEAWKNGSNLTDAFLDVIPAGGITLAASFPRREVIRRSIQADGTLLFTNLP
jgi:murein DD-endopeptidase MepM/ murein hydrolase activator NlpD